MAGIDGDVSEIGGWANPPTPNPRTLLSDTLNYELGSKSFTDILVEDGNEKLDVVSNEEERDTGFQFSSGVEPRLFDANKPNAQVGFAERMASRAGFSTLKIDTVRNKSEELNTSTSGVWCPYLTIPPGLSPTSLLDSPAFLSNMDQPSPTTGKLLFEPCHSANIVSTSAIPYGVKDQSHEVVPESFTFRPGLDLSSSHFPSADNKIKHQPSPKIQVSLPSDHPDQERNERGTASPFWNQYLQVGLSSSLDQEDVAKYAAPSLKVSDSVISIEQSPPLDGQQDEEADIKGKFSSMAVNQPDEDGYSWRKYGQKQVKGSEHPRSYYKCTSQSCQVKKKVERSLEGHITEIIYKGKHNHPKPPANLLSDGSEHPAQHAGIDGKPIWTSSQNSNEGRDWKHDGLEASSASAPGGFGDPSANELQFEPSDAAVAVSSTLSNEEEDDGGTHGSVSLGGDGEGDETESKRRKLDASAMDMSATSRAVREPRVVVQTTSEVDILDDGYRWRKYGQKIVKGNPNPRSYYKCTNPGCAVRKHVERASHDLKSVITTYEGKHNHDVPAARGSGHSNTGPPTAASATIPLPQNLNRRPEPTQMQNHLMRFNVPAQLGQPPVNFAFRMAQQGLNHHLGVTGLSMVRPMNTPAPSLHTHIIQQEQTEPRFVALKGETKEELRVQQFTTK